MKIKPRTTITIIAEHCELLIRRFNDDAKSGIGPQDKEDISYLEGQIAAYKHIIEFVRGL